MQGTIYEVVEQARKRRQPQPANKKARKLKQPRRKTARKSSSRVTRRRVRS